MKRSRKPLVEQYCSGRMMSPMEEIRWQAERIVAAKRGFAGPYPFLLPFRAKKDRNENF